LVYLLLATSSALLDTMATAVLSRHGRGLVYCFTVDLLFCHFLDRWFWQSAASTN